MDAENLKYINNGVAQDARMPKALHPDSVKPDGRSTVNLVSFFGQYARLLNYYKSEAEHLSREGDWSFFSKHPVFRLAEIANTDLTENRQNITIASDALQQEHASTDEKIYALRLLFDTIDVLFARINIWLGYIEELPKGYADNLIKMVQTNLSPMLNETRGYAFIYERYANSTHYTYFDEKKLDTFPDPYWKKDDRRPLFYTYLHPIETGSNTSIDYIIGQTYFSIIEVARNILYNANIFVTLAGEQFNSILHNRSDLRPDLGLLLAFLELFKKAQHRLNALSGKHLDFYYRNILKFREAAVVPDSTFLVMQLSPGCDDAIIPKGTAFDAGKDNAGNTIVFNAAQDTGLNQIQVADLRTAFIASTPGLLPLDANQDPIPLVTGVYTAVQTVPMVAGTTGFAVLGEDQFSRSNQTMQEVNTGFAVSSPALFLSGGVRNITFTFHLTDSFSTYFQNFVLAVTKKKTISKADTDLFFKRIFTNAFAVTATGAKGWFDVAVSGLSYSLDAGKVTISASVALAQTDPAVVAYNPQVHGTAYTTPYPVFNFSVQPTSPYMAYNFLKNGGLNAISVACDVSHFRNFSLRNQYGPIDTSQPFQPLGIQPDTGAFLMIGSNEIFIKQTEEIDLDITWQTLPSTGDFATYYKAYNLSPAIQNTSFRISPWFLINGKWTQSDKLPADFFLYADAPPPPGAGTIVVNPAVNGTSEYQLTPLTGLFTGTIDPSTVQVPPVYDPNTSQNGFIRFDLTAPQTGFGASVYGNLYTNTVLNNSKIQLENITTTSTGNPPSQQITPVYATPQPLPNAPFTPVAKSVELHYTSNDYIDLSSKAKAIDGFDPFYYIDTFATYAVKPSLPNVPSETGNTAVNTANDNAFPMVPSYATGGNLYIGLSNVNAPEELTLLLQLSEKSLEASVSELPAVKWSYLSANVWKDFVPGSDINDGTLGLIRPGIVTLDLHEDMTAQNTVLPAGLCWIRAQASEQLEIFGNLTAIYTQVIEAVYNGVNTLQRGSVVLPAGTISKSITPIAQIKTITQPFASTGGIAAEDQQAFYTRVSERLHHKQRAILPWDYERLALQQFQNIYKAKCIANSSQAPESFKNGNIDLVVIPRVEPGVSSSVNDAQPGPVFGFTMLEEIKQYLQQYTSVHAQLTIRNPVYERLIVKCSIKFVEGSPFSLKNLNEAICAFLSPWIKGNQIAYNIGDGIQKSTIFAFVQQLLYVEFVTGFSVIKITELNSVFYVYDSAAAQEPPPGNKLGISSGDFLYALTPYSVFASAQQHLLSEIDSVKYIVPTPIGLGDVAIGNDFIVLSGTAATPPTNYYFI
jgi:hypothetical protein